jgi:hypothetical protein
MHQVYAVGTYPTGSIVESRIEDHLSRERRHGVFGVWVNRTPCELSEAMRSAPPKPTNDRK